MKALYSFILILILILFNSAYAQEDISQEPAKEDVPEGMEIQKVGDLKLLVPKDSKMRKVGDLLVVESPTEYYRRTMVEVKEELSKLQENQENLRSELDDMKKKVDDIQNKNLVSDKKQ